MSIVARDIATGKFVRIGSGHTAAEAVGIAFNSESSALREIVIVVLDSEGGFNGLIEPRDLLDKIGSELLEAGDSSVGQVKAIRRGLACPVSEIARRDLPNATGDENLASLLVKAAGTDADYLPMFEGERFAGVIPVTVIFDALCQLVLSGRTDEMPFLNS